MATGNRANLKSQAICDNSENFNIKREEKIESQTSDTIDSKAANQSKVKLHYKNGEPGKHLFFYDKQC